MAEFGEARKKHERPRSDAFSQSARGAVLQDNRPTQRRSAQLEDNRVLPPYDRVLPEAQAPSVQLARPSPASDKTGLPDPLKAGIESLSGMNMDHVKVHYNSDKPAQLQAHAYAQGHEIHLGPGQERHLPHEAWHVVQQAQGRVRPTLQMKGGVINDDPSLEKEADRMGQNAALLGNHPDVREPVAAGRGTALGAAPLRQAAPLQMKWVEYEGKHFAWDKLIKGAQWYYHKESGLMFYDRDGVRSERKSRADWLLASGGNDSLKSEDPSIVKSDKVGRKGVVVTRIDTWDGGMDDALVDIEKEWKPEANSERTKEDHECTGSDWTNADDGADVASELQNPDYREDASVAPHFQQTFIAHYAGEAEPIAIMMVELREENREDKGKHLYIRWLVGSPLRKGGGSELIKTAIGLKVDAAIGPLSVEAARTAVDWYLSKGFKDIYPSAHEDIEKACGCRFMVLKKVEGT